MTDDIDEISLKTAKAIGDIDPDKLPGGATQAVARAQCLIRDAIEQAALAQGAEPVASDEPLSCPFCGDKPEWVKGDDPSWPQVQCKNLECPISHSDWISLDAWNRRAYTQPAAKVPEELAAHIRKMIELHERRSVVLSVHMQELEELLDATPQQSDEWVRCENRLPIYPPDKLMRNMRDAHDYALNCKDDGIEGPAAIWSVQVYSAVRQWLLAQPSKDK